MRRYFRIKTELGWVLNTRGIELSYKNLDLNRNLITNKDDTVFLFLKFLSKGRTKKEINSFSLLTSIEKEQLINHFIQKKYGYWDDQRDVTRSEAFINTIPETNYIDNKNKFGNTAILLLGVGTAGSYLVDFLIKIGFSNLTIIDGDLVEEGNIPAQNYTHSNIGLKKVEIFNKRYKNKSNLQTIPKFINSFKELSSTVDIDSYDYIINCTDYLPLMKDLITAKIKEEINGNLIESGYGVLLQTAYMIKNKKLAQDILKQVEELIFDSKNLIMSNNGSILDSAFSALSITKMILDDVTGLEETIISEADFLQNNYFIGSLLNYNYYQEYKSKRKRNARFKNIQSQEKQWIPKITNDNIFSLEANNLNNIKLSSYDKEFMFRKSDTNLLYLFEKRVNSYHILTDELNIEQENSIMEKFINYLNNHFCEDSVNRIKKTLSAYLIEDKTINMPRQLKSEKVNNNWFIFNTSFTNSFDKILGRIHECLHIVYWEITDNSFEHENFVMKNEIKFFEKIKNDDEKSYELFKYYIKQKVDFLFKILLFFTMKKLC